MKMLKVSGVLGESSQRILYFPARFSPVVSHVVSRCAVGSHIPAASGTVTSDVEKDRDVYSDMIPYHAPWYVCILARIGLTPTRYQSYKHHARCPLKSDVVNKVVGAR